MNMAYESQPQASKLPIVTAAARIVTVISLVVSIAIMKSNERSFNSGGVRFLLSYKFVGSYMYMLFSGVVGFAYTVLQTPFAVYYAMRRKRLVNHYAFLQFEFYGDKVISYLLATAVGAAFGVTEDRKGILDTNGSKGLPGSQSMYDEFYNIAYISAGFLLFGFVSSGVSAVISSLAVSKER